MVEKIILSKDCFENIMIFTLYFYFFVIAATE